MRSIGHSIHQSHALGALAVAALASASHAADSYTLTDLGVLPGGASSSGLGINSMSQIAGASDASDANGFGQRGMLVDDGTMTNLGLPPVPFVLFSTAPSLNDVGDIIVNGNNGAFHVFIWNSGAFTDITTLSNAVYSEGERINNGGQVVGSVTVQLPGNNFPHHGFFFDGKQMIDLNSHFGGNYSDATDVNDSGAIVGAARFAGSSIIHGFLLQDGVVTNLGPAPNITSEAEAISDNGQIAGGAYFDGVHEHPIIYANGEMTDLGLLPGGTGGSATSINDDGAVVGFCVINGMHRGFVYADGQMKALTGMLPAGSGWIIEDPSDINADGKIVATARNPQGMKHAVMLTPVIPCPADVTGNSSVDVDDLLAVISAWGQTSGPADITSNGVVDFDDLLAVLGAWGPCS